MPNTKLKARLKAQGVKQWEVAEALNIPEASFSRMMRRELDPEIFNSAMTIIDVIAKRKKQT